MKTKKEAWHPRNGWGVQIHTRANKDSFIWRHATDRAQWHSKVMAMCFADGLLAASFDRPFRLVDPDNKVVRKWGPAAAEASPDS